MVRIAHLDDAFSGILELRVSPVEALQQKDKKRRERNHYFIVQK